MPKPLLDRDRQADLTGIHGIALVDARNGFWQGPRGGELEARVIPFAAAAKPAAN